MSKIYGYKEEDVKNLYDFIKKNKNIPLAQAFFAYGKFYGKSKGTVRNLYYAMAKKSREDESFSKEYFCGEKISVKKNVKFAENEEKDLVRRIDGLKGQGYSVRRAVAELSGGDQALALRYQNKYRNLTKNKPRQKADGKSELVNKIFGDVYGKISTQKIEQVKESINSLYDKLIKDLKAENEFLRKKLIENGNNTQNNVKKMFADGIEGDILN